MALPACAEHKQLVLVDKSAGTQQQCRIVFVLAF
jgi:hypothetical protein